jgi:hypothetical protein
MALVGYVTFAAFGLIYWAIADYLDLQATPQWALAVGAIGAVVFSSSEIFNSGAGHKAGVLRRILITSGLFVVTGVVAGILSDALGWNQRTYFEDPWWLHNLVLAWAAFAIGLVAARVFWIGINHHDAKP